MQVPRYLRYAFRWVEVKLDCQRRRLERCITVTILAHVCTGLKSANLDEPVMRCRQKLATIGRLEISVSDSFTMTAV